MKLPILNMRIWVLILSLPLFAVAAPPKKGPAPSGSPDASPGATAEAEPKLKGYVIKRPNGSFLTFRGEDASFKLGFYDKKKKPMDPDVGRALVRYESPNYRVRHPVVVLSNATGNELASPQTVKPPYAYKVILSLFPPGAADGSEPTEIYTFTLNASGEGS